MRYLVTRYDNADDQPCDGAYKTQVLRKDTRTVDDPEKLRMGADAWYKEGAGHTVIDGKVVRYVFDEVWVIDIFYMSDLTNLIGAYGTCRINAVSPLFETLTHNPLLEIILGDVGHMVKLSAYDPKAYETEGYQPEGTGAPEGVHPPSGQGNVCVPGKPE